MYELMICEVITMELRVTWELFSFFAEFLALNVLLDCRVSTEDKFSFAISMHGISCSGCFYTFNLNGM